MAVRCYLAPGHVASAFFHGDCIRKPAVVLFRRTRMPIDRALCVMQLRAKMQAMD